MIKDKRGELLLVSIVSAIVVTIAPLGVVPGTADMRCRRQPFGNKTASQDRWAIGAKLLILKATTAV